MSQIPRISPEQAREETLAGRARLICAYGDTGKCQSILLEGAESWPEIRGRLSELRANQEIILYCA